MPKMQFQHHPLVKWPRKETPPHLRRRGLFQSKIPRTLARLAKELSSIGAINPILITTDHADEKMINIIGLPRDDIKAPKHPGVVLEFYAWLDGKDGERDQMQYACDTYRKWEHNLHAIVLTLESLRAVSRHGATNAGQQYIGFKALPDPSSQNITVEEAARRVAAISAVASPALLIDSKQSYLDAYRIAARKSHIDAGGTPQAWQQLQEADAVLRAHHHL